MKYFTKSELVCKCGCGVDGTTDELKEKLDALREACGFPLIINSGYRCRNHPVERKKKTIGRHAQGIAVDIRITDDVDVVKLIIEARKLGFKGLGVSENFIHIDLRKGGAWWVY